MRTINQSALLFQHASYISVIIIACSHLLENGTLLCVFVFIVAISFFVSAIKLVDMSTLFTTFIGRIQDLMGGG